MKRLFIISAIFLTLFLSVVYLTKDSSMSPNAPVEVSQNEEPTKIIQQFDNSKSIIQTAVISFRDLRVEAVDTFLNNYGPKMKGLGTAFVLAADKAGIPYNITPAIGACEGGLGNAIPKDSHNTWGWGIYGNKIKKFPNWETAITEVSKGLAKDYFAKGLNTPEKIMAKYTPSSNGSWANCVNKYIADLPTFE